MTRLRAPLGGPIAALSLGIALLTSPLGAAAPESDAAQPAEPGSASEALAGVLAAALQTVYDRYAASARPVPDAVRERLASEYGGELLLARYVVSQLAIDLLAAIDRFQGTSLGDGLHAVTVNDLIVFSDEPSEDDLWMWAHELHHVRQYQEHGSILAFARGYLAECAAIERAADERANRTLGTRFAPRHCLG